MFTRTMWDDKLRNKDTDAFFASYRMEAAPRRGEGFGQRDFALHNAAWLISDIISDRSADTGLREGFQGAIVNDTPVDRRKRTLALRTMRHAKSNALRGFLALICAASPISIRAGITVSVRTPKP